MAKTRIADDGGNDSKVATAKTRKVLQCARALNDDGNGDDGD